jgi:hypothetical protein
MMESYLPDLQDSFFGIPQDRTAEMLSAAGFPDTISSDVAM